jgi:hypothetical protein
MAAITITPALPLSSSGSSGLSDLADRKPTRLPKQILVIRINAFPPAEQGYVKGHRGTFFQFWAPFLTMNTFRGAAHACSADRELQLLRDRWNGAVQARQKVQHRDEVTIETVDFTFSPSATYKNKRPPLSWHLRMGEQAEIENAWNGIRTGEQVQKVLAHLGLLPVCPQPPRRSVWLNGKLNLSNPGSYHQVAARAWSRMLEGITTDEKE